MKIVISLLLLIPTAVQAFDHSGWDKILKDYTVVRGKQTLVHYEKLKGDRKKLKQYLNSLSSVKKEDYQKWSSNEKLAFLINAYNAFTVDLILEKYPLESIKDIGGWFSNAWDKKFFKLFGKDFYLDKIEHEIIRKKFDEPRIHFVVNCASMSCPSLLPEALTASELDEQLEKGAKNFLTFEKKNRYDSESKTLYLSKIFDWYGEDFAGTEKGIANYIKKYKTIGQVKDVKYLDYNWELNDAI